MSLTSHRLESFRVELLTRSESSLGDLDGVTGGELKWNANATLPAGGSIDLTQTAQEINFSSDRVRVWWSVPSAGEEWPLGIYVMAAPVQRYGAESLTRSVTLIDKLTVVADDRLTETLQIPAGANVVSEAVTQIQLTGESRIAWTESTKVLANAMTWAPGESRLQVVNDLLAAAGYWSLWTDRQGQFRVEPYSTPSDRPVVWEFREGETAIHTPDWEYELALWDATNTVVLVSQADDAGVVWTATAVDDNPASPTSTVSMGRTLNPIVQENVEATSQADLQAQANRILIDNSNVVGRLSVAHAAVPVWYREGVQFISQGVDTKATITQMSLRLAPGSLVRAEWSQA